MKPGLGQRLKEVWNGEVEGIVRRMHGVQWRTVREGMEARVDDWREGERKV